MDLWWAFWKSVGELERAASEDQVIWRKTEMMRKRAMSATDSVEAPAPLV